MYPLVRNAMKVLAEGASAHIVGMGVSKSDFSRLTGATPWLAADRSGVRNTMDAVLFAAQDYLGLPRHEMSAEYVAAGITMFVHPVNRHAACNWFSAGRTAQDLAVNPNSGAAPVSPQQLEALCLMADGDTETTGEFIASFEKKTKMAIEHATEALVTGA